LGASQAVAQARVLLLLQIIQWVSIAQLCCICYVLCLSLLFTLSILEEEDQEFDNALDTLLNSNENSEVEIVNVTQGKFEYQGTAIRKEVLPQAREV
jgi:hypothetical protein